MLKINSRDSKYIFVAENIQLIFKFISLTSYDVWYNSISSFFLQKSRDTKKSPSWLTYTKNYTEQQLGNAERDGSFGNFGANFGRCLDGHLANSFGTDSAYSFQSCAGSFQSSAQSYGLQFEQSLLSATTFHCLTTKYVRIFKT